MRGFFWTVKLNHNMKDLNGTYWMFSMPDCRDVNKHKYIIQNEQLECSTKTDRMHTGHAFGNE